MKILGAELLEFINSGWPGVDTGQDDDWFWEHDLFDGDPEPTERYDTDDIGPLIYQGPSSETPAVTELDLATLIRRWRKAKTHDTVVVQIDRSKMSDFKAALAQFGGRIVTDPTT